MSPSSPDVPAPAPVRVPDDEEPVPLLPPEDDDEPEEPVEPPRAPDEPEELLLLLPPPPPARGLRVDARESDVCGSAVRVVARNESGMRIEKNFMVMICGVVFVCLEI